MILATAIQPIVDLRREPCELIPRDFSHNPLRDSQILFGEKLRIHRKEGDYFYIEALDQQKFTESLGWHGYFGWVHKNEIRRVSKFTPTNLVVTVPWAKIFRDPRNLHPHGFSLSYGTSVFGKKIQNSWELFLHGKFIGFAKGSSLRSHRSNRSFFHKEAIRFIDAPYLWGGRCFPNAQASVDCSGLVCLLLKTQGISIPRDAHDQYLKGKPITLSQLAAGDGVYLLKKDHQRVSHVILALHPTLFIESPQTGQTVRLLKLGKEIEFKDDKCLIQGRPQEYFFFCRRFIDYS